MRFLGKLIASFKKRFLGKKKRKKTSRPRIRKIPSRKKFSPQRKRSKSSPIKSRKKHKISRTSSRRTRQPSARRKLKIRLPSKKKAPPQKRSQHTPQIKRLHHSSLAISPPEQKKKNRILVGEVTHYFSKIEVCVLKVTREPVSLGESIWIEGPSTKLFQKVESLQIENDAVKFAPRGKLVGLKVQSKVKEGDLVYKV